ncbi:YdiY family protein [Marinicaulis aureus]|uniref:YdiY family protein n=1 Tax=Hyphococcus aureus TaxID=2666033 RepID=A0ABW1KXF7_9PROT
MDRRFVSGAAALLSISSAHAAEAPGAMPDIAAAMLYAAQESGDADEITAVAKAVKAVFPDYAEAIDASAETRIAEIAPAEETEEAAPAPSGGLLAVKPWDGKISASGLLSTGNSENAAVGIAVDAARADGDFKHNIKAFFDLGESNNVTNQKRWGASYKLDYNFTDHTYAYGRVSYVEDDFSGFDYRLFGGAGLGHYFLKSEELSWKLEGGPGYRYSPIDDTRDIEKEVALYAASEFDWLIREGIKFEQDFEVTWTSPTTTFQSVTALTTQLWGDISTGLSFEYRYETDPPLGRENTDTIAKASLIYGF